MILFLLCFRVEVNLRDSAPIPGLSRPTIWVGITCRGINLSPRIKQRFIDLHVALRRRYKANRAVPMLVVVPVHQLCHPATRLQQAAKRFDGHLRTVLQRPEQSASEYGLSLQTAGLLREPATPKRCIVASIASPFMGEPLSE